MKTNNAKIPFCGAKRRHAVYYYVTTKIYNNTDVIKCIRITAPLVHSALHRILRAEEMT